MEDFLLEHNARVCLCPDDISFHVVLANYDCESLRKMHALMCLERSFLSLVEIVYYKQEMLVIVSSFEFYFS